MKKSLLMMAGILALFSFIIIYQLVPEVMDQSQLMSTEQDSKGYPWQYFIYRYINR